MLRWQKIQEMFNIAISEVFCWLHCVKFSFQVGGLYCDIGAEKRMLRDRTKEGVINAGVNFKLQHVFSNNKFNITISKEAKHHREHSLSSQPQPITGMPHSASEIQEKSGLKGMLRRTAKFVKINTYSLFFSF